ncbi:DNA methyltransferase [Streptococcus intermedius]|uniref:DNA methyltransferase n=1 Tax=Streptococcus intermedius TaxID=1338 RepID=UPI0015E06571|nr:DNA methyltransferase [Streptococcus intermedius]
MPQSSIRPRVLEKIGHHNLSRDSVFSIEYIPKTGRNKGKLYEQFYKGEKLRLFAWFSDVAIKENSKVFKKDIEGTLWDGINLNNLTKEGQVRFDNGKKPLDLLSRILKMYPSDSSTVLDFFAGFRVIIMTQANSQVNTRVLELLPKFKIKKMNRWCAV